VTWIIQALTCTCITFLYMWISFSFYWFKARIPMMLFFFRWHCHDIFPRVKNRVFSRVKKDHVSYLRIFYSAPCCTYMQPYISRMQTMSFCHRYVNNARLVNALIATIVIVFMKLLIEMLTIRLILYRIEN